MWEDSHSHRSWRTRTRSSCTCCSSRLLSAELSAPFALLRLYTCSLSSLPSLSVLFTFTVHPQFPHPAIPSRIFIHNYPRTRPSILNSYRIPCLSFFLCDCLISSFSSGMHVHAQEKKKYPKSRCNIRISAVRYRVDQVFNSNYVCIQARHTTRRRLRFAQLSVCMSTRRTR